jgi:hypothetical protein
LFADEIGHHAEDADGSKEKSDDRINSQHHRGVDKPSHRFAQRLFVRHDRIKRQRGIERGERPAGR